MSHARPNDEALLRSILHAAADQIEPSGDGLQRIKHRLRRPRPVAVAWGEIMWTRLSMRVSSACLSLADWLAAEVKLAAERFMPPPADRNGGLRWLRPIAAMGTAVVIIGAVVYMAAGVSQIATSTSNDSGSTNAGHHHGNGQTGPGGGQAQTASGGTNGSSPGSSPGSLSGTNCSTGTGKKTPVPTISSASPSTSPSSTGSPSPSSGSPTTTPSPSQTPTPTPSASSSTSTSAPGTGDSPSAGAVTTNTAGPGSETASRTGHSSTDRMAQLTSKTSQSTKPGSSTKPSQTLHPTTSASCGTSASSKAASDTGTPGAIGQLQAPVLSATQPRGKLG